MSTDSQSPRLPLPPANVLIVSREPKTAGLLAEALAHNGVPVETLEGAQAAWERIRQEGIGLIVLDLTSPRLDDLVLLRTVRSCLRTIDIPFLFLLRSDYKMPTLDGIMHEMARDGWLTLPCPAQQFALLARRMLQQMARGRDRSGLAALASKTSLLKRRPLLIAGAPDAAHVEEEPEPETPPGEAPLFAGQLSTIDVPQILNFIEPKRLTGKLTVTDGKREGAVYFLDGACHHAKLIEIEGPDALFLLFHLKEGAFRFNTCEVVPERTIQGNVTALLLEGLRQMDMAKAAIKHYQEHKKK
jgi:CheY-like chemotaxis protein